MKRGLKLLLISDAWINLALGMIGPIYAIFVEHIGGDILDASFAYSAYMFTAGIVMYLISKWEDHVKHKEKFVIAGYILCSLTCLSYFFVYNQTTLLFTQVLLGISLALLDPSFDSLYSHYVKKSEEASSWGTWEAMNNIVVAISAIIGGFLANQFGFKVLFLIMFVVSLLGPITAIRLFRKKKYLHSE